MTLTLPKPQNFTTSVEAYHISRTFSTLPISISITISICALKTQPTQTTTPISPGKNFIPLEKHE
jgi:hypothetical protein